MIVAICLVTAIPVMAYETYSLYNTSNSTTTRLINWNKTLVKTWTCTRTPSAATPWLILPDSVLLRPQMVSNPSMNGGGCGGNIQKISWTGTVLWNYTAYGTNYQQHHNVLPMPNGNVLYIAWERKTNAEAIAMGRQSLSGEMWPDKIVEVNPTNSATVWEWKFWDHLIQDVDPGKPNYGVVRDHPELLDINAGQVMGGDWMHTNFVDYNPQLNQIVISCHNLHEIYVIDHSTTTAEAAGHTGGNSGMGGDLLYRWGNPRFYDRGTTADQHFFVVHGVNWIDAGLPGVGNLMVLNNGDRSGSSNDYSSAEEIITPVTGYTYYIHPDSAFGPAAPAWTYSQPGTFYSTHLGGAFRLSNGNTYICSGTQGRIFEVTPAGAVAWTHSVGGELGNSTRYDLDAGSILEEGGRSAEEGFLPRISPNPVTRHALISYTVPEKCHVKLSVYDISGRMMVPLVEGEKEAGRYQVRFDRRDMAAGVYLVRLSMRLLETEPAIFAEGIAELVVVR